MLSDLLFGMDNESDRASRLSVPVIERTMIGHSLQRTVIGIGGMGDEEIQVPIIKREDFSPTQQEKKSIDAGDSTYTLEKLLGVGGMGEVWKATCCYNAGPGLADDVEQDVAIKFITELGNNSQLQRRFVREAQLTAGLLHDNITGLKHWGWLPNSKTHYIVMDYIEGMDVEGLIKLHRPSGRIHHKIAAFILHQVLNALDTAHNSKKGKVIHRDVTLGNILIKKEEGAVKLSDFGIAVTATDLEEEGGIIAGKVPYMSPEAIFDPETVDERSDLYSLGVVMYEMLTGFRPNDIRYSNAYDMPDEEGDPSYANIYAFMYQFSETLNKILVPPHYLVKSFGGKTEIDMELSEIVDRLLQPEQGKRFQTAKDAYEAVRQYLYRTYGPTKPSMRDYIDVIETGNPGSITLEQAQNLSFMDLFPAYELTNWSRYKKEKKGNPARMGAEEREEYEEWKKEQTSSKEEK
jgi:serine/threonine protein kinase